MVVVETLLESRSLGKRGRLEGEEGVCDGRDRSKRSKIWAFGNGSVLSGLTKMVSVVSDALTSLWRTSEDDACDVQEMWDCPDTEYVKESSEDTETKYQRMLSTCSIERPGPPTVELSVARPVKPLSRVALKQQLLDKVSMGSSVGRKNVTFEKERNRLTHGGLASSRGARMLTLVPKHDGVVDASRDAFKEDSKIDRAYTSHENKDYVGCDQVQEEVSLVDMPCCVEAEQGQRCSSPVVLFSESGSPGGCKDGETVCRAMNVVGSLVAELGMEDEVSAGTSRMLLFGDDLGNEHSSELLVNGESPQVVENIYQASTDDFTGFNAITPFEARCSREVPIFSPLPLMLPRADEADCVVIENHTAELSPEDCTNHEESPFGNLEQHIDDAPCSGMVVEDDLQHHLETEEPISSAAARQGSLKSAKALLKKRMMLKQAEEDALFIRLREVVVNRHLVEKYDQGHSWARLDARGVELNCSIDHALLEDEVLNFVRQEKGDDILNGYLCKIEEEWQHISSVRQKYSMCEDTPTRSILKRSLPGHKNPHHTLTLRWAVENIHHRYPAMEVDTEDHQALRRPSSTRGLRMLLASASPNVVVPSPKNSSMDQETEKTEAKKRATNSRSRSRTLGAPSGRASQGQRLFQALQQGSCCAEQQIHAPRTLSMIFDRIDDDNECYSNMSNSMTTSDNTTSSNSSSRGGLPVGGRWTAEEVTCLIQGFKECIREDATRKNLWKNILDAYRGRGISECRTSNDVKDKWKNLRKTALKNSTCRYVKLDEETLSWLRSDDANPHSRRTST